MYRTNNPQNTTSVDELPELEDIEGPQQFQNAVRNNYKGSRYPDGIPNGIMPPNSEKFERFRRNSHLAPEEAGMTQAQYNVPQEQYVPQSPEHIPARIERYEGNTDPTCLQVANHIANCPLCSKYYNNDKTVYIIAIVILTIVCILLLKKILNI